MQDKFKNYIGQKGYSIYKKNLTIQEQNLIRQDLIVSASIPNSPIKPLPFPIYLESPDKIYVPRYYGINNFGPANLKITKGDEISVNFDGELRDYQNNIANIFVNYVKKEEEGGGALIDLPCGRGKTVIAIKIFTLLRKKTLIIVHKGFLLNQWIERLKQFCPDAKIGLIQGQKIDIDDKDIVIGMLQSLSMKEYPNDIFKSFGFTIIDECHHISSEIFSRTLQKIVTYYSLGLSATMNRKDGLTKVFKMYLGEIIYKEKREIGDNVLVKSIIYENEDKEYNEVEIDFRGNVKYSTMISKICNFNMRSEFIINIIDNELKNNINQQILLLAHNRSLLTYIFKAIEHRIIYSVGYYVGGMKEKNLKESENKKIILATYSMAAEALDIKSLTTLVLATPKTDIIQAVGRILRMKHDNPLILDIQDTHDVFQKQFKKRKNYYIKNKYKIIEYSNNEYFKDKFNVIFDPLSCTKKLTNKENLPDFNKDNLFKEGQCFIDLY